jgi:exosome complex component RRP42
LLSQSEKSYHKVAIDSDIRGDGRGCFDFRNYSVDLGVFSMAHGSARLRLGTCDILATVKLELGTPDVSQPSLGKVHYNVECSANVSQDFEGKGAEEFNQELSEFIDQFIGNALIKQHLIILEGEHCWIMYIDVLLLDYGGNLVDAIVLAVRSALFNTKIPKVQIVESTRELVISEDLDEAEHMDVSRLPLCLTLCKLGDKYIVDPQWQEEICADVILSMGVTREGRLFGVMKRGAGTLSTSLLTQMMYKVNEISGKFHEKHEHLLREANSRMLPFGSKSTFFT